MNRHRLTIAVAALALSGVANAADLRGPLPEPPPYAPPPPVYGVDWSGPYVGLNVGYGGGDNAFHYDVSADPIYFSAHDGHQNNGIIGGVQVGYNYAFNGFLVGVEADFQGSGIQGSAVLDSSNVYGRVSTKLNDFGTVRGRLGYAFDRVMLYGTGGFAYGETDTFVKAPDDMIYDNIHHFQTGYAVGGGFEFAATNNIMLRAEYLRLEFGGKAATRGNPWVSYKLNEGSTENIVRAGVDYKFDLFGFGTRPGPVLARY